jgi:hypothetical protein
METQELIETEKTAIKPSARRTFFMVGSSKDEQSAVHREWIVVEATWTLNGEGCPNIASAPK